MARLEEADVIIKQQIAKAAQTGVRKINVVCEDTCLRTPNSAILHQVESELLFYNGSTKC